MATSDAPIRVGDWLVIDNTEYLVCEYDEPTEQFFILRYGRDAGEFVNAPRLAAALAEGRVALAVRQLALTGLEG